jgi:hypothetical protein
MDFLALWLKHAGVLPYETIMTKTFDYAIVATEKAVKTINL